MLHPRSHNLGVIGRSRRLSTLTLKHQQDIRGWGEGDADAVGGFAAFDGQESKCLEGHGWPREAPSPGTLRVPTSPTRGEVATSSAQVRFQKPQRLVQPA